MDPDLARRIVADHIVAAGINTLIDNEIWEDYPKIGEYDWETIITHVGERAKYPSSETFAEAYKTLAARADDHA